MVESLVSTNEAAWHQEGLCSWYSDSRNASGKAVHVGDLTAAHRTLPFGTRVKVTRTDTGVSVIVIIEDRGPHIAGRIIDLRPAAATVLHMKEAGVVPVRIEKVEK